MVSGLQIELQSILRGHWQYDEDRIFPQSVLVADVSRQNYTLYPRAYYVDMLATCRKCQRPFLFFAKEQQHWYEALRLYVDADCVHCPGCRKALHRERRLLKRYASLVTLEQPTRKQLMQLVDDTIALLQTAHLKNTARLSSLKSKARREIPEYAGTQQLSALTEQSQTPKTLPAKLNNG